MCESVDGYESSGACNSELRVQQQRQRFNKRKSILTDNGYPSAKICMGETDDLLEKLLNEYLVQKYNTSRLTLWQWTQLRNQCHDWLSLLNGHFYSHKIHPRDVYRSAREDGYDPEQPLRISTTPRLALDRLGQFLDMIHQFRYQLDDSGTTPMGRQLRMIRRQQVEQRNHRLMDRYDYYAQNVFVSGKTLYFRVRTFKRSETTYVLTLEQEQTFPLKILATSFHGDSFENLSSSAIFDSRSPNQADGRMIKILFCWDRDPSDIVDLQWMWQHMEHPFPRLTDLRLESDGWLFCDNPSPLGHDPLHHHRHVGLPALNPTLFLNSELNHQALANIRQSFFYCGIHQSMMILDNTKSSFHADLHMKPLSDHPKIHRTTLDCIDDFHVSSTWNRERCRTRSSSTCKPELPITLETIRSSILTSEQMQQRKESPIVKCVFALTWNQTKIGPLSFVMGDKPVTCLSERLVQMECLWQETDDMNQLVKCCKEHGLEFVSVSELWDMIGQYTLEGPTTTNPFKNSSLRHHVSLVLNVGQRW